MARVAEHLATSVEAIERALFADLHGAHRLLAFNATSPEALIASYEMQQGQAVLLRAMRVVVDVECASAGALRGLFRKLKFLRLLHTLTRTERGIRIVVDGPLSLFESVTKYGLQLALVLPALEQCDSWTLAADVSWGKDRVPLTFRLAGRGREAEEQAAPLPDEIRALVRGFVALKTGWRVRESSRVLDLPGVGLIVPDLVFQRPSARAGRPDDEVFLEVLGFWSRTAVWQRVELVQAGLAQKILFAVSSRLRVSEEVLTSDLPGALYVYKRTMNPRAIADRLDELVTRR
jgi:predicted nuclease of restriction endonuclease-like RecB superfamily